MLVGLTIPPEGVVNRVEVEVTTLPGLELVLEVVLEVELVDVKTVVDEVVDTEEELREDEELDDVEEEDEDELDWEDETCVLELVLIDVELLLWSRFSR